MGSDNDARIAAAKYGCVFPPEADAPGTLWLDMQLHVGGRDALALAAVLVACGYSAGDMIREDIARLSAEGHDGAEASIESVRAALVAALADIR